jgi:hypothetical protein
MQRRKILTEAEQLEIINELASQETGRRFLQWLCHDVCNYQITSIAYENGELSLNATTFNEARKDIWRIIRPYILAGELAKIETLDVLLDQEALMEHEDVAEEAEETEES